jgi:hypothetical protein
MNENRTSDLRENKSPGYTLIGFRKPFQNAAPKLLIQRSHRKHLLGFRKEMSLLKKSVLEPILFAVTSPAVLRSTAGRNSADDGTATAGRVVVLGGV